MSNKMPETCDTYWTYSYDKSKPVSKQCVHQDRHGKILNVSKIYTNGIYFGISIQLVDTKNKLYTMVKCKDRGITEEQADNKDYFLDIWASELLADLSDNGEQYKFNNIATTVIQPNYIFDKINTNNVTVVYGYVDNVYRFTNILVGEFVSRGIYSVKDITKKPATICIPMGSTPTDEQVTSLYEQTKISLNNVWTYVNTDYSAIKIFRSDIS
jgi:hypothetical protein